MKLNKSRGLMVPLVMQIRVSTLSWQLPNYVIGNKLWVMFTQKVGSLYCSLPQSYNCLFLMCFSRKYFDILENRKFEGLFLNCPSSVSFFLPPLLSLHTDIFHIKSRSPLLNTVVIIDTSSLSPSKCRHIQAISRNRTIKDLTRI